MKTMLIALGALLLVPLGATAQTPPDADVPGIERGIQEVNNSGQVGTMTLVDRGGKTQVSVSLRGTGNGLQSVRIYRGKSCEDDIAEKPAYFLGDLRNGNASSLVAIDRGRLTSGNYNLLVFSSTRAGARVTACGHIYAS